MKNDRVTYQPSTKLYRHLVIILLSLIVILAITAGFYQQLHVLELKRYKKIEDQFVRLRSQLGVEKTNQLIENSYTDSVNNNN